MGTATSPLHRRLRKWILILVSMVGLVSVGSILYRMNDPDFDFQPGIDWDPPSGLNGSGFIDVDRYEDHRRISRPGKGFQDQVIEETSILSFRVWKLMMWIKTTERKADPMIDEMTPTLSRAATEGGGRRSHPLLELNFDGA